MKFALLSAVVFVISVQMAFAQCTLSLNTAEDDYDKGRLLDIPSRLAFCLKNNGFSREERIRAYKLLTKVYIFSDQESKAEEALVNLLKADPEHELNSLFDPAELFYLYDKFRVKPIFRASLRFGGNLTIPNVFESFTAFSDPFGLDAGTARTYSDQLGFYLEAAVERHLVKGIEIGLGFQYSQSSLTIQEDFIGTSISLNVNESQRWFKAPLFARYNFFYEDKKRFIPYVEAGGVFNYLLSATFVDSERIGGTQRSVNDYDLLAQEERNRVLFSVFVGAGLKMRTNKVNFFSIEGRYELGLKNYVNSQNRFVSNESITGLSYVP
ncbi:MAG: outer membrane beta-barrel protein, partial [Bacteroidota bacterium]